LSTLMRWLRSVVMVVCSMVISCVGVG